MKLKKLKPDGAYGAEINGYGTANAELKSQFLRDARGLLVEVSKHLAAHGLTEWEASINPAGPAVSGDVSATYWQPGNPERRVYVNVSASSVGWGRRDGVILLARVQFYSSERQRARKGKPIWRMSQSGPNQWLSANFDSKELADHLWQIFQPDQSLAEMVAYTSTGDQVIPSPIAATEREASAWADGMQAIETAFARDNDDALALKPVPVPVTLSLFNELE